MARRYRFPMASLLRLREQVEETRKREFAEAARAIREEQERRQGFVRNRGELQDEIVQLYAEKVPFAQITAIYREVGRLAGEIMRSEIREKQLEALLEQARQRLLDAQRDRRVLETLRDNRKAEFDRETERMEQAQLDELSIRARARFLAENPPDQ